MMVEDEGLKEKKLRGSGGFVIALVSDDEQKKGNLGGPELFIAGIGRLDKDRILKYYCNKCEKDYSESPDIIYENPNEEVGEGVILIEKGEYKCQFCKTTISQYRKFNNEEDLKSSSSGKISDRLTHNVTIPPSTEEQEQKNNKTLKKTIDTKKIETKNIEKYKSSNVSFSTDKYFPIQVLIDMPVYDQEAMLVGNVKEIGLKKNSNGTIEITVLVTSKKISDDQDNNFKEITWTNISKIGDIILVSNDQDKKSRIDSNSNQEKIKICDSCMFQNTTDAIYCEECGKKLN
jgi:sporulation protein YlmC with PRC-barrel domain